MAELLDDREGWERSDFPIVCETCLGDNPYIRMTKNDFDKECKICTRPFTVFRWKAGTKGRYKKTEICQVCAKLKNVCQTCLLDLTFNLPVQVRDSAMTSAMSELDVGVDQANKNYYGQLALERVKNGEVPYAKAQYNPSIQALARTEPYYERNRAPICSFFVKGNCNRGDRCPYRHEEPKEENELSRQNIKDRYYGRNDPVANKIMKRAEKHKLSTPSDINIKTLYIGGIRDNTITQDSLKTALYYHGEILSVNMVPDQQCAFVEFATREAAESAADEHNSGSIIVEGISLKLGWSTPKPQKPKETKTEGTNRYASMDPNRLGSIVGPKIPDHLRRNTTNSTPSLAPSINAAPDVDDD